MYNRIPPQIILRCGKNFKKYFLGKILTVRYLTLNKYGCPTQLTAVGIRNDL